MSNLKHVTVCEHINIKHQNFYYISIIYFGQIARKIHNSHFPYGIIYTLHFQRSRKLPDHQFLLVKFESGW